MATRFNYSSQLVGQRLYRGRSIPARITDVIERVHENGRGPVPALVITYSPPNDALEMQVYEGAGDAIPVDSDLGKLIKTFEGMGIDNINAGDKDFAPLREKYVWLEVQAVNTARGVEYKRFPRRWMSEEEINEEFGKSSILSGMEKHKSLIEQQLDGFGVSAVPIRLVSIRELRPYLEEVERAITNDTLTQWLIDNTSLRPVQESGETVFRKE